MPVMLETRWNNMGDYLVNELNWERNERQHRCFDEAKQAATKTGRSRVLRDGVLSVR